MSFAAAGYLAICAVVGVGIIAYSLVQRSRLRASQAWPVATGTITKAVLEEHGSSDSAEYSVSVLYEYEVNGVRYTGRRVGFGRRGYARKKNAQAQLDRYPLNSSVMVFFNPAKPEEAVLEREAPFTTLYLIVGVVSLAFVVVMVLAILSRGR